MGRGGGNKKRKEQKRIAASNLKLNCNLCGKKFKLTGGLESHVKDVHGKGGFCAKCNMVFPRKGVWTGVCFHVNTEIMNKVSESEPVGFLKNSDMVTFSSNLPGRNNATTDDRYLIRVTHIHHSTLYDGGERNVDERISEIVIVEIGGKGFKQRRIRRRKQSRRQQGVENDKENRSRKQKGMKPP
ncbi:hypothetical protein V6N11_053740 [Hibiscus sabdariffa]|uniref:C2H2-type domain-containing protein n=1 Tax=Hibiscus sabdariffa TaxID=183260 RepID=A0ABR2S210_9ROSI